MTELYQQLIEQKISINTVKEYERQMPENRRKVHEIILYLVCGLEMPIKRIADELSIDRGKVYRMLKGEDVDYLPHRWSLEEDAELRKLHGKKTNREIANEIGRTKASITQRARALGLKKPWPRQPQADHNEPF